MYWPYLNVRQEELLALTMVGHRVNSLVVPILRPFSDSGRAHGQALGVANAGFRVAVIVNPEEPRSFVTAHVDPLVTAIDALGALLPAIELRSGTTSSEVRSFVAGFPNRQCVVVHRDHSFFNGALSMLLGPLSGTPPIHVFIAGNRPARHAAAYVPTGGKRVLVRDGFRLVTPNGAYPPTSDFDDLVFTHSGGGWDGFGDFAAIGDSTSRQRGGVASHFVFHVTEEDATPNVICNHFVSTVPTNANYRAKFASSRA